MPRGGKRAGAGRPAGTAKTSWEEKIEIAYECHRRWTLAQEAKLQAAYDAALSNAPYLTEGRYDAVVRSTPVEERWKYVPARDDHGNPRFDESGALEYAHPAGEDHAADLADNLRVIDSSSSDEGNPSRILSVTVTKPYAMREPIIREVASWASARFGKPISLATVERCWKRRGI